MPESNNPALSYEAGTALIKWRLATLNTSDDVVDYCSATTAPMGITTDTVDAGEIQGVRLLSAGKAEGIAAVNDIALFERLYTAANGKLTNVPVDGCYFVGFALQASTAVDDVIDWLPLPVPLPVQDLAAATYVAPSGGATQDAEARASLAQLAADFADLRASVVASKLFLT